MTKPGESIGAIIHRELLRRNWTQSDLARAMWPGETIIDSRGYTAPRGRDRISAWIADKQVPSVAMLRRLAEVLGLDPNELQPNGLAAPKERATPSLAINMLAGTPDRVLIQVNRLVPLKTALQIAKLIEELGED